MHRRRAVRGACVLVPLLALATAVPAAAQCLNGTRPLITAERAFFSETLEAIRSAMPDPPEGWRTADATEVRAPRGICIGRERQPLSMEFFVRFEPIEGGSGARPQIVPASQGARDARDARILVTVNARQELFDARAKRLSVSRVTLALGDSAAAGGQTSLGLLIGDWSLFRPLDPSERLEAMAHFDDEVAYTRVQSLSVQLDGPSGPVTDLLSGLDLEALTTLLPGTGTPSGKRH